MYKDAPDLHFEDLVTALVKILVASPIALFALCVSSSCGYGMSFILLDYHRQEARKSHRLLHPALGIAFAACVFLLVNHDIITHNLTGDQIGQRMPLTLIVTCAVAFPIMVAGIAYRQSSNARRSREREKNASAQGA
jgi:hypothetical protein